MNPEEAEIYANILRGYAAKGEAPSLAALEERYANASVAIKSIAARKLIVVDKDGAPYGAYPFTSENRKHQVHLGDVMVHCMCALDALAVSPMLNKQTKVESRCHVSDARVYLEQNGCAFSRGTLDVWFGIDWGAARGGSVCAQSLCMKMIFLENQSLAIEWVADSPETREVFDLASAAEFASCFFKPLAKKCLLRVP